MTKRGTTKRTKMKEVGLHIDADLYKALVMSAHASERSISGQIRFFVKRKLETLGYLEPVGSTYVKALKRESRGYTRGSYTNGTNR